MQLIRGESLLTYADSHQLSTRRRLELIAEVCDAVQRMHERGIIHCDLKPANIVVDESGQTKVLDFGLARATGSNVPTTLQNNPKRIVGTPAYMSPELVLGNPVDVRSDVHALGIILYELLAGRHPYKVRSHVSEVLHAIIKEDPAPLSSRGRSFHGDLEKIVAKALEKKKDRRYASAGDLARDIRCHLNNEPIVARSPSVTRQLRKFARHHKTLMVGGAAFVAVLIAGVLVNTRKAAPLRREERI